MSGIASDNRKKLPLSTVDEICILYRLCRIQLEEKLDEEQKKELEAEKRELIKESLAEHHKWCQRSEPWKLGLVALTAKDMEDCIGNISKPWDINVGIYDTLDSGPQNQDYPKDDGKENVILEAIRSGPPPADCPNQISFQYLMVLHWLYRTKYRSAPWNYEYRDMRTWFHERAMEYLFKPSAMDVDKVNKALIFVGIIPATGNFPPHKELFYWGGLPWLPRVEHKR
ncbi:MAG: hypothetical protein MMC33_003747 [Icmadophila ericetorum]|nr:hypothetical protein [Icmadophila ericetorum]